MVRVSTCGLAADFPAYFRESAQWPGWQGSWFAPLQAASDQKKVLALRGIESFAIVDGARSCYLPATTNEWRVPEDETDFVRVPSPVTVQ